MDLYMRIDYKNGIVKVKGDVAQRTFERLVFYCW